ncbi:MAG: acetylglutamate kinase [Planctomycetota bacterium]
MTVVVKISGKPLADASAAASLAASIGSLADPVVLVHGGGPQLDALFERLGEPVRRLAGIRLTTDAQMPLVAGVLAGDVNQSLVSTLRAAGSPAVGLSLASHGVVDTGVHPVAGGRVGAVAGGDGSTLRLLLGQGLLPVVASVGSDGRGGLLNVNADDAAAGIARALGASRLIFLTDVPGVLDASGGVVRDLPVDAIDGMIVSGVIAGGMAAKVRAIGELAMGFDGVSSCDVLIAGWADIEPAAHGDAGVGTRVRWDAAWEEQAG